MTQGLTRLESATVLASAAQGAAALYVWRYGSDGPVPVHFNALGDVDRWGDRTDIAMVMGLMAGLTLVCGAALGFAARRPEAEGDRRRTLGWGQLILLATLSILTGMMFALGSGSIDPTADGPGFVIMAVSAVFAVIGAVVGKVPPNALVGVRTPWSLTSRLAWEKSNRLAGRLFFWVGIAGLLVGPLLPRGAAHMAIVVSALAIGGISIFESWRVWRTDPDRRLV